MIVGLTVHPIALREITKSISYYRDVDPAIANQFIDYYDAALKQILASPFSNPVIVDPFRRKIFRKFPFSIIYYSTRTEVRVVAVAHHKRRPLYWLGRN